jgi:hypothetical protein
LTVSGITANNKVYDGTTAATLNLGSAALAGAVSGDAVTLNSGSAAGAFASKTVGTAKTVAVSALSISGADAANYTLAQPGTSANITAKGLTVSGITTSNKIWRHTTNHSRHGSRHPQRCPQRRRRDVEHRQRDGNLCQQGRRHGQVRDRERSDDQRR